MFILLQNDMGGDGPLHGSTEKENCGNPQKVTCSHENEKFPSGLMEDRSFNTWGWCGGGGRKITAFSCEVAVM